MLFSMSAALSSCFPMPSCASMHSLMASVNGPPGKEEAFLLDKSHLMLKKVLFFFFRKRLTRLNKEDGENVPRGSTVLGLNRSGF